MTYIAQFDSSVNEYTVVWKNDDGSVLETDEDVAYGTVPAYNGTVPTKATTAQYTYTFAGWDPEVVEVTGDVTYIATYTQMVNRYDVIWEDHDGALIEKDTSVEYGVTPEFNGTEPSRAADKEFTYKFVGWTPAIDNVECNITYTATYSKTAIVYTLTLKIDETLSEIYEGNYGDVVPVIADPERRGYTFLKWSADIPATFIDNTIIDALWEENVYNIVYKNVYDEGGNPVSYKVTTPDIVLRDVSKAGYVFGGWYLDAEFSKPIDVIKSGSIGSLELYARFTPSEHIGYSVEHYIEKIGGGYELNKIEVLYGTTDQGTEAAPLVYVGFRPLSFSQSVIAGDGSAVVKIYYDRDVFRIVFDTDGGSKVSPIEQDFGTVVVAPADPTKVGYTFAGWDKSIPATMPAENITITAKWDVRTYEITWDIDGDLTGQGVEYGAIISIPEDPIKVGHTFLGWYLGDSKYVFSTMPAENLTLVAKWSVNDYSVIWDIDGHQIQHHYNYGDEIIALDDPEKVGHTFVGWDSEIPITMPAESLIIHATWIVNQYTITFDTVGGSVVDAITQDYNSAVIAPADPTKVGHTFVGWDKAIPETMPAENITITAKWAVNSYSLIYSVDGTIPDGYAVPVISDVEYGTDVNLSDVPEMDGYTFIGWYYDGHICETFVMPAKDVEVTGTWMRVSEPIDVSVDLDGNLSDDSREEIRDYLDSLGDDEPAHVVIQSTSSDSITIPTGIIKDVLGNGSGSEVVLVLPDGEVTITSDSLNGLDLSGNNLTVTMGSMENNDLPEGFPSVSDDGSIFEVVIKDDKGVVTDVEGGFLASVHYELEDGKELDDVKVKYFDDEAGIWCNAKIVGYDESTHLLTFVADGSNIYVVSCESDTEVIMKVSPILIMIVIMAIGLLLMSRKS